jgi:hypothetical protein
MSLRADDDVEGDVRFRARCSVLALAMEIRPIACLLQHSKGIVHALHRYVYIANAYTCQAKRPCAASLPRCSGRIYM